MSKRVAQAHVPVRSVAAGAARVTAGSLAGQPSPARAAGLSAAESPVTYTKNVAIVVYEGVEILDFAGPAEVFEVAAGNGSHREQPAFKVYTVGTSRAPIKSQRFVTITPEFTIDGAPKPDIVVIPGGSTQALVENDAFMTWATSAMKDAKLTLTVCTGAFVPARAGLLDGLNVTTWYGAIARLREAAPKATVQDGRRFVDSGAVITTAGVSAGIDGALHTVARLLGRDVADRTARYMEYHWTPEPYLAQTYAHLNPSLDDGGRALQQAAIDEDAKDYARAERAYRGMIEKDPKDGFAWYRLGYVLMGQGRMDDALKALERAAATPELRLKSLYNMACADALQGKLDGAFDRLKQAIDAGFKDKRSLEGDPDLASLRKDPRYQQLVARLP